MAYWEGGGAEAEVEEGDSGSGGDGTFYISLSIHSKTTSLSQRTSSRILFGDGGGGRRGGRERREIKVGNLMQASAWMNCVAILGSCTSSFPPYRIKYVPHLHIGVDGWCIYPSYDFTHDISNSLEHMCSY